MRNPKVSAPVLQLVLLNEACRDCAKDLENVSVLFWPDEVRMLSYMTDCDHEWFNGCIVLISETVNGLSSRTNLRLLVLKEMPYLSEESGL